MQLLGPKLTFDSSSPGAVPERGEIGGRRHRRARWSIHSGQKTRHSGRCGACRQLSGEARDRLWRSGSRPPISSTHGPRPLRWGDVGRYGEMRGDTGSSGSSVRPLGASCDDLRVGVRRAAQVNDNVKHSSFAFWLLPPPRGVFRRLFYVTREKWQI